MSESFRVGVNYWPASSAMRWWQQFDGDETARDFARMRASGGDLVRLFLLWEDFQPDPERWFRDDRNRHVDAGRECYLAAFRYHREHQRPALPGQCHAHVFCGEPVGQRARAFVLSRMVAWTRA